MKLKYFAVLLLSLLWACKNETFEEPNYKQCEISVSEIVGEGNKSTGVFEIQTTSETMWRISPKNLEWFTFSELRGKGSAEIEYTFDESLEEVVREGEFLLEAFVYGEPFFEKTVKVKQMPLSPYVYVGEDGLEVITDVDAYGVKDAVMKVYSNTAWKVDAVASQEDDTCVDWITFDKTEGEKRQEIKVTVAPYTGLDADRTACIKLYSEENEGLVHYVNVKQSKLNVGAVVDVRLTVVGMTDYVSSGKGEIRLLRLLDNVEITSDVSVTVADGNTVFALAAPLQTLKYRLLEYTSELGETKQLGVTVDLTNGNPEVTTSRWDANFSRFGGDSEEEPLLLYNEVDLKKLATIVNGGESYSGVYIKLNNEIQLTEVWKPIGISGKPFMGHFDGGKYAITGLRMTGATKFSGLFGVVKGESAGQMASVKNVILKSSVPEGEYDVVANGPMVGAVVGYVENNATISSCINELKMKLRKMSGGIVGSAGSTHENQFPAFTDRLNIHIEDCHNKGNIGMVGHATPASNTYNLGGITGINMGYVTRCSNSGTITLLNDKFIQVGGIVGINAGEIRESYNIAEINGYNNCGGIAGIGHGQCAHAIYDCYNTGNINSQLSPGGIIGAVPDKSTATVTIINCYDIGKTNPQSGGIIGTMNKQPKFIIRFCATTQSQAAGTSNNDLSGDTGMTLDRGDRLKILSKEQMVKKVTFTTDKWSSASPNWDFNEIWDIDEGSSTPYLKNNKPESLPVIPE